jgi:selenocysteine-specific elongation factor
MLIGMAGHVNHGKTTLVRALTGIDTDRLPEEKRRGLSIDLGFAYTEAHNGQIMGFVDVPGHDRYLHNMISGILPLDCVLLVVAADEGPGRQTAEHLAILDMIGTRYLLAVVTRIDRADEIALARTQAQLRAALSRTRFAAADMFCVSSTTGAGIGALRQHLYGLPAGADRGLSEAGFRLHVDRAFTLPGIGTVATGTVVSGTVCVDDKLFLSPSGVGVRVRSLHAQNRPVTSACHGVRCALAIAGTDLELGRIKRGDMLVAPRLWEPAGRIGVSLRLAEGISLRNGDVLQLYHGTGRTAARLNVIDKQVSTREAVAELLPAHPIAVLYGDRVLLRNESAKMTIAGGTVIDPYLDSRGTNRQARFARLTAVREPGHGDALAAMIELAGVVEFRKFCLARNLSPPEVQSLAARFARDATKSGDNIVILSRQLHERTKTRLVEGLAGFHAKYPGTLGPKREEALRLMGRELAGAAARGCLAEALAEELVVRDGACIRLKSHRPHLGPEDEQVWRRLRPILDAAQLRPPHIGALGEALGLPFKDMERCLLRFEKFGLLRRIARNRFFLPATIDQFAAMAQELDREREGEGFTAADFNRVSGVGRNLSIEILEYLDGIGVTRRIGSRRRLA